MGRTANEDQSESISERSGPKTGSPSGRPGKGRRQAVTGFGFAMMIVLLFAVGFWKFFKTVQVSGRSMYPTFKDGQRILVCSAYWLPFVGPIKDGDVVVLKDTGPTGYIIKRVCWMGGEKVDWKWSPDSYDIRNGQFQVPPGNIYVMGDNRPESEDSRRFGPRPISDVLGKVLRR